MGTVKSIRFNKKVETMFGVIREYYQKRGGQITDSEIITNGIQMQYEEIVEDVNESFREKILSELSSKESINVFRHVANMLEILRISAGDTLESEFWCFLLVNVECGSVYDTENGEKVCQTKQYMKIYEVLEDSFDEHILENALSEINVAYRKLFGKE